MVATRRMTLALATILLLLLLANCATAQGGRIMLVSPPRERGATFRPERLAGFERVLDRADLVDTGSWTSMEGVTEEASLYRLALEGDEPLMVVRVTCPSTGRVYLLRVDPDAYGGLAGEGSARAAVASTWRKPDGSMVFARPDDYVLAAAS